MILYRQKNTQKALFCSFSTSLQDKNKFTHAQWRKIQNVVVFQEYKFSCIFCNQFPPVFYYHQCEMLAHSVLSSRPGPIHIQKSSFLSFFSFKYKNQLFTDCNCDCNISELRAQTTTNGSDRNGRRAINHSLRGELVVHVLFPFSR